MSKELGIEVRSPGPFGRVQLILIERDSAWRVRRRRTFTIRRSDLESAIRDAGLAEIITGPERVVPATTEAEQLKLANEIAWYQTQLDRNGGSPMSAKEIRDTLWVRINKKLGLT